MVAEGAGVPLIGNGDVFSYADWQRQMDEGGVTTCMIGRAALIKPWVFTGEGEKEGWVEL